MAYSRGGPRNFVVHNAAQMNEALYKRACQIVRAMDMVSCTTLGKALGCDVTRTRPLLERMDRDGITHPPVNGFQRKVVK